MPVRIASDISTSTPKPHAMSSVASGRERGGQRRLIHRVGEVQNLVQGAEGQEQQDQQTAHDDTTTMLRNASSSRRRNHVRCRYIVASGARSGNICCAGVPLPSLLQE